MDLFERFTSTRSPICNLVNDCISKFTITSRPPATSMVIWILEPIRWVDWRGHGERLVPAQSLELEDAKWDRLLRARMRLSQLE